METFPTFNKFRAFNKTVRTGNKFKINKGKTYDYIYSGLNETKVLTPCF